MLLAIMNILFKFGISAIISRFVEPKIGCKSIGKTSYIKMNKKSKKCCQPVDFVCISLEIFIRQSLVRYVQFD